MYKPYYLDLLVRTCEIVEILRNIANNIAAVIISFNLEINFVEAVNNTTLLAN